MWFFAILIVLALGGVAVLAAGRGAPLAEAYDDRPDAARARRRARCGAEDLRRVRFSIALRGYRMSEVDALLDRLAAEREQEPRRTRRRVPRTGPTRVVASDPLRRAHFRTCRPRSSSTS